MCICRLTDVLRQVIPLSLFRNQRQSNKQSVYPEESRVVVDSSPVLAHIEHILPEQSPISELLQKNNRLLIAATTQLCNPEALVEQGDGVIWNLPASFHCGDRGFPDTAQMSKWLK